MSVRGSQRSGNILDDGLPPEDCHVVLRLGIALFFFFRDICILDDGLPPEVCLHRNTVRTFSSSRARALSLSRALSLFLAHTRTRAHTHRLTHAHTHTLFFLQPVPVSLLGALFVGKDAYALTTGLVFPRSL